MDDPKAATRDELTRRCGHECLNQPDHDDPHFYGYRLGPYSYEGLLTECDRYRKALEQVVHLAEQIHADPPELLDDALDIARAALEDKTR